MRYPESKMSLDSAMPTSSIQAWLGQELEMRGIDAMIYTRYILSILQQDSFEFEHIESDLFPLKKDLVQVKKEFHLKGKTRIKKGDRRWSVDGEEMKKTAAVECLMSVSDVTEKDEGLKNLVEETYRKLKEQHHYVETTCEALSGVCVTPVATCVSPGAAASAPSPTIPAVVCIPDIEESLMKEEVKTTSEGYYDAFPPLIDKDETDPIPTPKEKTNATVWNKKNAKLSPSTSDVERTTPNELNQSRSASNPQFRRSQSRGSGGESDDSQKARKSRRRSRDHDTSSPGQNQRKPDHQVKYYGSRSAESYSKNYRGQQRSHSQKYRSRSQEKFTKHTPRPYVFYKLKSNRDTKGQFGRDTYQPGRNRARQAGASFFTPRYPISPAKLGKSPKFSDSLKITDDILRLLHVRPEQEQWFDDLVSGNFPRHPIKVGHHPRRPKDDNEDDLFLYEGPIETVFPPSETRQGRLYERHSCSSVDDLVMAADVTDTVTTVDTTDNKKSSRFLPFILSSDQDDSLDDFSLNISLNLIEQDLQGSDEEVTPRDDKNTDPLENQFDGLPELIKRGTSPYQHSATGNEGYGEAAVSPCASDDTLKTSSSSGSESTEEDEYDFSRFTDFIENKKKGLVEHIGTESVSDGTIGKTRCEKLALQIDGAQSRGISLLRELQPENSDWLRGDEESSGSENEERSPNLAKKIVPCKERIISVDEGEILTRAEEQIDLETTSEFQAEIANIKENDIEPDEEKEGDGLEVDSGDLFYDLESGEEIKVQKVNKKEIDTENQESEIAGHKDACDVENEEALEPGKDIEPIIVSKMSPDIAFVKDTSPSSIEEPISQELEDDTTEATIEQTGLEEMFEKLGIFGKAIENICKEIKQIEVVNDAADDAQQVSLLHLPPGDRGPGFIPESCTIPALVDKVEEKGKDIHQPKSGKNLIVDASAANLLTTTPLDTGLLSPNRPRLDGFPSLLPKEEEVIVSEKGCIPVGEEKEGLDIGPAMLKVDGQQDTLQTSRPEICLLSPNRSRFGGFPVLLPKEEVPEECSIKTNMVDVDHLEDSLHASTPDTGLLSPNRSRLGGFPSLLPKQKEATEKSEATTQEEKAGDIETHMVNIDLQSDDCFIKLQDLTTFLDFKVEDIKELLPKEASQVIKADMACNEDIEAMATKSIDLPKTGMPRYLSDNKENESLVLSQSREAESSDPEVDVKMQVFTVPASGLKQSEGIFLTKEDVVVRVANDDSSDEDSTDESDAESIGTAGSDGYSEILGDLDSVLAGINISSDEITADMAENSAQFLEDLKLLDDSLDLSTSTDDNSESDAVSHGDPWIISDRDDVLSKQLPPEPVHHGLHRSLSDRSDHGLLGQPELECGSATIKCDNTWTVSDEDTIQTQQYKQLDNNQQEPILHPGLHRSVSDMSDEGPLQIAVHGSGVLGEGHTWAVSEDDTFQSNNNQDLKYQPGLRHSLSGDRSLCSNDLKLHDDSWTVLSEDTLQSTQVNNNQEIPVGHITHSGLHRSFSNRSDHGLIPPIINLETDFTDVQSHDIGMHDHDKTTDSGISHYVEENCEMAENIAFATCGNLSSDGDSSSETSERPCLYSPENETPLAKHIAAITRRRHPGIGKKWPPPAPIQDNQDDGYGEGHIWPPQQDNKKNLLQVVDNQMWNTGNLSQTSYLSSPRNPDQANWGSLSDTTGSGFTSKDHSPWPTLDNMLHPDNSDWQDRSTPSFSSTSSHGMRKVDADWQTLQVNTSESAGLGEPLYVNVNDTSFDNSGDTLYFLPSLSDSPKVEDLLAEASSVLDGMDPERFHQLLIDIENQSEGDAANMGDFSEALQKLAVNEENYAVLQELDKLFQTYMHSDGLPDDDDDKLLMDAGSDLAQFSDQDQDRCMSPGGEEYSGQDDHYSSKRAAPGNVGQGDPTYNLWNDSGKEFSGHLNWYIGGEDTVGNISKGHSCSDIAYWSDTESTPEKLDSGIHTSASYGQLSSLTRKRSRYQQDGPYLSLPHSQSANLQPSEFSAFKDKIPQKMSHVRSEPQLSARSRRNLSIFKSDSDLLNKTAPVITLQKETKATIGEGYNKKETAEPSNDVVISPKTHFRPIHSLTQGSEKSGYNANAAAITGTVDTSIQHVEKPPLFSFSPDKDEDYQLFVTSDSDSESSFVPKFKVKLDGEKWSQTDKLPKKRTSKDRKLKSTSSFTDDCMETCRKKLEQCSQEILLQCKKHLKSQLREAILEEEDVSVGREEDSAASDDNFSIHGNVTSNEIIICDLNGNIGETCTEPTSVSQECETTNVGASCHNQNCFCPECGIQRQVCTPEPYWPSSQSLYSCSGLGMDKKIVENRDGESLQGGSICLGNIVNVEGDRICYNLKHEGVVDNTADIGKDTGLESGSIDRPKEVEDLDIVALCNTVDLMQVGDECSPNKLSDQTEEEDMKKQVISTGGDCGEKPQVAVQDVAEIWAAGIDPFISAEPVTKKYSIWSVGGDVSLPSLPAGVLDDLDEIFPGCLTSGASNTLKEKPCSKDEQLDDSKEEYIIMEDEAFPIEEHTKKDLDLSFIQPPHRPRAFYSSELEEVWMRSSDMPDSWFNRRRRRSRSGSISNKPCSFYMEGNCRRSDCRFSHDLSSITCRFWERGECFKGVTCPFMHAFNSSAEKKSSTKPDSLQLESKDEDFTQLSQESKSDEENSS